MKEIKIYISLKEAEELIFNHCLLVEKERLEIKRAQGTLSICIFLNIEKLIDFEDNFIVLSTSINYFEIPVKDETLFLNHYNIPQGLIRLNPREVRDIKDELQLSEKSIDTKNYKYLRNGLLGVYHFGYLMSTVKSYQVKSAKVIQAFSSLTDIKKKLLLELLKESKFPLLTVKIDKFVTDTFFRVTWWGKFVVDNYLSNLDIEEEERIISIRKWLRGFLEFDNIKGLNKQLLEIPIELKEEVDFLLGYYFAAIYLESCEAENDFFEKLYKAIKYKNKDEMFSWILFFNSVFNQKQSSLYFVKSLNEDTYKIEKLAFELAQNNFKLLQKENYDIKFKNISEDNLISEYLELKDGVSNIKPQIIKLKDAKSVYKNNFFEDELLKIGLELKSQFDGNSNIQNSCWFTKNEFNLKLNAFVNPKDIVYYTEQDSKSTEKLKQLKLKVKPFSKLLDETKRVLVGFINLKETPKLCNLYATYFKDRIEANFDRVVFVLLVQLDSEELQSIEFNNFVKDQEVDLKRLFGSNVELIVKNERTTNDTEIKRNLKNVLKNYKTKQIEVIDENFDEEKAGWLIECNAEYFIEDKNHSYYSFFNLN